MAYRQNYLDLDPIYRDRYGRPLLRMTFDFHANEQKQANYIADICKIGQAMGADRVVRRAPPQRYSIVPYQSTTGGIPDSSCNGSRSHRRSYRRAPGS